MFWGKLYEAALLETDDKKLPSCLQAAKAAINTRLQEIRADRNSPPEELQAIADAPRFESAANGVRKTHLMKHASVGAHK